MTKCIVDLGGDKLSIHHHNGICLIEEMFLVEILGRRVVLTHFEFFIFKKLISNPGRCFTRTDLIKEIESETRNEHLGSERIIDTKIKFIRKKLLPNNKELAHELIESVYGIGYRMNDLRKGGGK